MNVHCLCMQSFLTLYTSCVREMVQLVKGCPNADPGLQNPGARFASDTERRLQSLVRLQLSPLAVQDSSAIPGSALPGALTA